jgi:hypothetical protein
VLIGKRTLAHPYGTQFVARRFDPAAAAFGPPVAVSPRAERDVIFMDAFQDAGGTTAVVWIDNGRHDPLRYRASTNGGRSWRRERTLVARTNDGAYNLQLGTGPDGGGFVTWDRNSKGPLKAVAVPPIVQRR